MAGAEAAVGVGGEGFVKQGGAAPMRIVGEPAKLSLPRTPAAGVGDEYARKAGVELARDFEQCFHLARTRRAFDLEILPIVVMVAFQCLDQKIVEGKPDGAAPVRVAA